MNYGNFENRLECRQNARKCKRVRPENRSGTQNALRVSSRSSITLLKATAGFPEEKICYVLPTTLAAIQENRRVIATWEMKETVSPIDGSRCWKKVRSLVLGDSLDKEAGK